LPALSVRRAALLVASLGAIVHVGALWNGFAYDDVVLIAGDPGIRTLEGLLHRLAEPSWPGSFGDQVGGWRPLTTALWAFTWIATGGSTVGFHLLGILLHACACALVVLLLAELMSLPAALLGGLVFSVHPVHVEAIANIAGTAEPLATAFALAAAIVHLRARSRYGVGRALVVTSCYALAVLAKEGAAVLPLLLMLLDAARGEWEYETLLPWFRQKGVVFGLIFATLGVLLVARVGVVGGVTTATMPPGGSVLEEIPRIWTLAAVWPEYFRLLLFPLDLSADYGPDVIPIAFAWTAEGVLGVTLVLTTLILTGLVWRQGGPVGTRRLLALGVLWIASALLPVANVLFFGPVLVAERTLYLPSVGLAIACGWLLGEFHRLRPRHAKVLVTVLVVAGAARTATRVPDWDSTDSVMIALIEDHPESGRGWLALGQRLLAQGRESEARRAFSYAVGILNSEYKESTEIASHLMAMGRPNSARLFLERAWREHPEWPTAPGLLASVELNAGRFSEAEQAARAATLAQPSNGSLHHLLAQALSRLGRHEDAVVSRVRALESGLEQQFRPWVLLAGDHASAGDTLAALAALDSAEARARSPAELDVTRQARLALAAFSDSNELD
jgi:Flp pilus assembly protein TadD